jgi:hypothetical protein
MRNKTFITVSSINFGEYYIVKRDVTEMVVSDLESVIESMNNELRDKIKQENQRKPLLPC